MIFHVNKLLFFFLGLISVSAAALSISAPPIPTLPDPIPADNSDAICFDFTEKNWIFKNNRWAKGWPKVINSGELTLIPDNLFSAGTAAILKNTLRPPFEVTFEFSTFDDDGGRNLFWNSADGIAFFFFKNGINFGTPPNGNQMGFSRSGGGYAVALPIYGQRKATLRTADNIDLKSVPFRLAYSNGRWVPMRIQIMPNQIKVWGGKLKLIDTSLNFDTTNMDLGFSAATGQADSEHKIRNFCLRPLLFPTLDKPAADKLATGEVVNPPTPIAETKAQPPTPKKQSVEDIISQEKLSEPEKTLPQQENTLQAPQFQKDEVEFNQ